MDGRNEKQDACPQQEEVLALRTAIYNYATANTKKKYMIKLFVLKCVNVQTVSTKNTGGYSVCNNVN